MSEDEGRRSDERPVLPEEAIEDLDPGSDADDVSGGGALPQAIKGEQGPG